jgi:hypothetical protein
MASDGEYFYSSASCHQFYMFFFHIQNLDKKKTKIEIRLFGTGRSLEQTIGGKNIIQV